MLQALLSISEGQEGGILEKATVKEMFRPQLNDIQQASLQDTVNRRHNGMIPEFPPRTTVQHGIGGIMNVEDVPGKRRAGSMEWMGMANCHWVSSYARGLCYNRLTNNGVVDRSCDRHCSNANCECISISRYCCYKAVRRT
jgi:hypothetical protein